MKKILLMLIATFSVAISSFAGDVVYKTITFTEETSEKCSGYSKQFKTECDGLVAVLTNFNNNSFNNSWTYVKCGSKNAASTATIRTEIISKPITKVAVTVDVLKETEKIDAAYLIIASDTNFTKNVQKKEVPMVQGVMNYTVDTPAENMYYKLVYDCQKTSANGIIQISKIEFFIEDNSTLQAPVITPESGSYNGSVRVTISDPSGNNYTIFYTLDGSEPTEKSDVYIYPLTLTQTFTVKAIIVDDDDNMSSVASATYIVTPSYTAISDMNAACTVDKVNVLFTTEEMLVTGVNGSNVYVSDSTGSFLLYGSGTPLKKGDIVKGTVKGQLYLYNNLPELAISGGWSDMTVVSSNNEVNPVLMAPAEITAADASKFVRLENLSYLSKETVSNKTNYLFKKGATEITLRDNFNNLEGVNFSTDCHYNLNVFVCPFKETIQFYAVSADDIEIISDLTVPTASWAEAKVCVAVGDTVNNKFASTSDAPVTYESSNTNVATIDEAGNITIVGVGSAVISAKQAKTDKYLGTEAKFTLAVTSGAKGTEDDPFLTTDILAYYVDGDTIADIWVKGYIVGFADGSMSKVVLGTENALKTNIILASTPDSVDKQTMLPVALETSPKASLAVRDSINLNVHPEMLGVEVMLHGKVVKYFSQAGLKSVDKVVICNSGNTTPEDVNADGNVDTQDILVIYDYMQESTYDKKADVNADGNVDTQDVLVIYDYMQDN